MDYATIAQLPPELIEPLVWVGSNMDPVIQPLPDEQKTVIGYQGGKIELTPQEWNSRPRGFWDSVWGIIHHGDARVRIGLIAHAAVLSSGTKMFRPNMEQCLALEQMEVTIPFADYHPAYDNFVVEMPEPYRERLKAELSYSISHVVVSRQNIGGIIVVAIFTPPSNTKQISAILVDRYPTLEAALCYGSDDKADMRAAHRCERVALNFGAYLAMVGCHIVGPVDPEASKKNAALARSGNKERARRGRAAMMGEVQLCELDQQVTFHEVRLAKPRKGGEKTGRRNKPHWRRGHWRNQPYGVGRAERRYIPIKPILINAELFGGRLADTVAVYNPEEKGG